MRGGMLMMALYLTSAYAADLPKVLSLDEAIRLAIERNPLIQAARSEILMSEGDLVTASKRLNPAFTLESENYPYFQPNPGPFLSNQEITARVDYEIQTRGRRKLRTEAARLAVEMQKSLYRDRVRQLRLDVQRAYYQVVLARSNLNVAKTVLEQTDRVIELNRVRYKQGDISELELTRVEVERLRFVDDVFQSELALKNAKATLLALLNADDLSADFDVVGELPVSDPAKEIGVPWGATLAELRRMAFENRADLRAAIEQERRADTQTRLQRAIRSPNVTVGAGYKRNGPVNSMIFGVTVPLRIFNRNQGGILRADAERRRAASLAAAVRKRIELELQKAWNAVEINRKRVEYIEKEQLRKAEEASTVTLAAYRLGGAPLMDLLDAQRRYRETVRIYNQALYDERISLYELAGVLGIGTGDR